MGDAPLCYTIVRTSQIMLRPTQKMENALRQQGFCHIAGCDEAGRGAWAGPLAAAAVILPSGVRLPGVRDSKTVPEDERERLYNVIVRAAVAWHVVVYDAAMIDGQGLQHVNLYALRDAVRGLAVPADHVVSDWFNLASFGFSCTPVVDGDARVLCVAAASILAKVTRDRLMRAYDAADGRFGFAAHKGYGTPEHQAALARHGVSPIHRRSFEPIRALLADSVV